MTTQIAATYATKNGYNSLAKFKNIREFNSNFEQAMLDVKADFTKSEYIALNKLRKFAAEIAGVAWCKLQTAVASTHVSEQMGVSRSSFDRMIRKAKKLNLITVIPQQRANHYRKHNVYVFNRADELAIDGIVSDLRTIEVADNANIDVAITSNLSKLSLSKQVIDKYKSATTEKEGKEAPMSREQLSVYASNPFQMAFYDVVTAMPYDTSIKVATPVLALRIGSVCDSKRFDCAKRVIHSIAMQINDGYKFDNIVATFTAALDKAVEYKEIIAKERKQARKVAPVPFYDWLKIRG